jgi:hypothetical protein
MKLCKAAKSVKKFASNDSLWKTTDESEITAATQQIM